MSRFNKKTTFISTILVTALTTIGLYIFINSRSSVAAFEYFPQNQAQTINFPTNINSFNSYTKRQKKNQFLDWLILTIESDPTFSVREIAEMTYDSFPIRYDYLRPITNFDYGDTRSFYTGKNKNTIVALIPKDISPAEQADYLASIADKHRQNLGKIPKNLALFEYEFDSDLQTAQISYTKNISTDTLFQEEQYGYFEASINSFDDLSNFMAKTDDITFARVQGRKLIVGGRKIQSHEYGTISPEDVATLWQSEHKLIKQPFTINEDGKLDRQTVNGSGFSLDPAFDYQGLKDSLIAIEPKLIALNSDDRSFVSEAEIQAVASSLSEKNIVPYLELVEKIQQDLKSKDNGVFKTFNQKVNQKVEQQVATKREEFNQQVTQYKNQLQAELDNIAQEIQKSNSPLAEKEQLYNQKAQEQSAKLNNYQQELENKINADIQQFVAQEESIFTDINQFLKTPNTQGFQKARYDGELQGTEVGMILYYTDLLAKLWALDYLGTTPAQYITDFEPLIQKAQKVASIYQTELQELPSTRLWFGHKDKGFQLINNGNGIAMARNATRIYAASSNPLKPGAESTAAVTSEAFLGWWNEHYSEVARYESQYERLNEIMKWSLVISWLNQNREDEFLTFLQDVKVNRDYWFPDWVKANIEKLKFKEWATENCSENANAPVEGAQVCFYPSGHQNLTTEAMPLLKSKTFTQFGENRFISGGVSLANRQLIAKQTPLPRFRRISDRILRGNIDYKSTKSQKDLLSFATLDGVTYGMTMSDSLGLVTAIAQEGAKLRNLDRELDNIEISQQVSRNGSETKINLKAENVDIGSFSSSKQGNTFLLKWESLDIDVGQSVALELSSSRNEPSSFLSSHPQVNSLAVQQDGSTHYVKLDNSKSWLKLASGGADSVDIPDGWISRIASNKNSNSYDYLLTWIGDADVQQQLNSGKVKEVALSS